MKLLPVLCAATFLLPFPSGAQANELFGGIHAHDVKTPLDASGIESGIDFSFGYRGSAIGHLWGAQLQPYIFAALNSSGGTNYAASGVAVRWSVGRGFYVRPAFGIAVHTGSAGKFYRTDRVAFGSRLLFEPEIAVGSQLSSRISVEASWVHLSHAQIFGKENPGIDNVGMRINLAL